MSPKVETSRQRLLNEVESTLFGDKEVINAVMHQMDRELVLAAQIYSRNGSNYAKRPTSYWYACRKTEMK